MITFLRQQKLQAFLSTYKGDLHGYLRTSSTIMSRLYTSVSLISPVNVFKRFFQLAEWVHNDTVLPSGQQPGIVGAETKWPGQRINADKSPPFIRLECLLF